MLVKCIPGQGSTLNPEKQRNLQHHQPLMGFKRSQATTTDSQSTINVGLEVSTTTTDIGMKSQPDFPF